MKPGDRADLFHHRVTIQKLTSIPDRSRDRGLVAMSQVVLVELDEGPQFWALPRSLKPLSGHRDDRYEPAWADPAGAPMNCSWPFHPPFSTDTAPYRL